MTHDQRVAIITTQTRLEPVPLVPEIRIHAASELTPLWAATQTTLDLHELEPPFWAFAWPGGQALARYILDQRAVVAGCAVLDFASGSGLVGIAASLAGAARVVAADIDELACEALLLNAAAANVSIESSSVDRVGAPLSAIDVVLAGDVFYDREASARFDRWFRALVASGVRVLVGDPGRAYLPADLVALASYEVPVAFEVESAQTKTTRVLCYPNPPLAQR